MRAQDYFSPEDRDKIENLRNRLAKDSSVIANDMANTIKTKMDKHYYLAAYYAALIVTRGMKYSLERSKGGQKYTEIIELMAELSGDMTAADIDKDKDGS